MSRTRMPEKGDFCRSRTHWSIYFSIFFRVSRCLISTKWKLPVWGKASREWTLRKKMNMFLASCLMKNTTTKWPQTGASNKAIIRFIGKSLRCIQNEDQHFSRMSTKSTWMNDSWSDFWNEKNCTHGLGEVRRGEGRRGEGGKTLKLGKHQTNVDKNNFSTSRTTTTTKYANQCCGRAQTTETKVLKRTGRNQTQASYYW